MSLIQQISQDDIYILWQKNLMAELCMPFTPQSHQYALWILDQCNPKFKEKLMEKIWNRFYEIRN